MQRKFAIFAAIALLSGCATCQLVLLAGAAFLAWIIPSVIAARKPRKDQQQLEAERRRKLGYED